jgi:hypothetical protein
VVEEVGQVSSVREFAESMQNASDEFNDRVSAAASTYSDAANAYNDEVDTARLQYNRATVNARAAFMGDDEDVPAEKRKK